jgi:L-fuconolactonase
MPDFPIVDSHVHLWDISRLDYAWLNAFPLINKTHLTEHFFKECTPVLVSKIVFIECGGVTKNGLSEIDLISEIARNSSNIKAIVAHAPLELGLSVEEKLISFSKNPLIRGVRRLIQSEEDSNFCLNRDFIAAIKLLPQYNYTFDICIYHYQMDAVLNLVRQCPEVKFVLDHLGKPPIKLGFLDPWRSKIKALSKESNVWCKLSGLVTEADYLHWTPEDLKPYLSHVIECFGFSRLMFGGDWPVAKLATDYPRWVHTLDTLLHSINSTERENLFIKTAESFYTI